MRLLTLLLALTLIAGCASRGDSGEDYSHLIHYQNTNLEGRLQITEVVETQAGDVMRAQVTLHNPSAFRARYSYKFRWFDQNDFEVSPAGSPWTPNELPSRSHTRVQGVAPNPSAVRFEVWVRDN